MDANADLADTPTLLGRMVDAITAAQTQTAWPAAELTELAADVFGEAGSSRVWALS